MSTYWGDDRELSYCWLELNNSNLSWINSSLSGNSGWCNLSLDPDQFRKLSLGNIPWRIFAMDSAGNINNTSIQWFQLWGWAQLKLVSVQNLSDGIVQRGQVLRLNCSVRDQDTLELISEYNVSLRIGNQSIAQAPTWDGYVTLSWNTTGYELGEHGLSCFIQDDPAKFYNASIPAADLSIQLWASTACPIQIQPQQPILNFPLNLSIQLRYDNQSSIKNQPIQIMISHAQLSRSYSVHTDHAGFANLSFSPWDWGEFRIEASYPGNSSVFALSCSNSLSFLAYNLSRIEILAPRIPAGLEANYSRPGKIQVECKVKDQAGFPIRNYPVSLSIIPAQIQLDASTDLNGVAKFSLSLNQPGSYDIHCNISDRELYLAVNRSSRLSLVIDSKPPWNLTAWLAPIKPWYNASDSIWINLTGMDDHGILEVKLGNLSWDELRPGAQLCLDFPGFSLSDSHWSGYCNLSDRIAARNLSLELVAWDYAGNENSIWINLSLDPEPPAINRIDLIYPRDQSYAKPGDEIMIKANVTDELSGVRALNLSWIEICSLEPRFELHEAIYQARCQISSKVGHGILDLSLSATDWANNTNITRFQLKIDRQPPWIKLESHVDGQSTYDASIKLCGVISGTGSAPMLKLNGNPIGLELAGELGRFCHTLELKIGINTIILEAWDQALNHAATQLKLNRLELPKPAAAPAAPPAVPAPMIMPTPKPAQISVTKLELSSNRVIHGQPVILLVYLRNLGDLNGSIQLELKLNGMVEWIKEVVVEPGETVVRSELLKSIGRYSLELAGLRAEFEVVPEYRIIAQASAQLRLLPGEPKQLKLDQPQISKFITKLEARSNFQLDAEIQLRLLESLPYQLAISTPGVGYAYFQLDAPREVEILLEFKLENSWLEANLISAGDVGLYRFKDGIWSLINTKLISSDHNYSYYSSLIPGSSDFGIFGLKSRIELRHEYGPIQLLFLGLLLCGIILGIILIRVYRK